VPLISSIKAVTVDEFIRNQSNLDKISNKKLPALRGRNIAIHSH
jgi:hypothetical protein